MQFNVAQLLKSPVGETRQHEVDESLAEIEGNPTTEPVRGRVKLTRTPRGILVDASLTTAVKLSCGRCLEDLIAPLRIRIHEEFRPTVDIATGLPAQTPEEGEFTIDEHHILDLTEPVRQYGLLEIPLQPLCSEDCQGLCPICGKNRKREPCDCPTEPEVGGLAGLARLLEQEATSEEEVKE